MQYNLYRQASKRLGVGLVTVLRLQSWLCAIAALGDGRLALAVSIIDSKFRNWTVYDTIYCQLFLRNFRRCNLTLVQQGPHIGAPIGS